MLFDLIDLLMRPDAYVCMWRDGGLFVEPVPATCAVTTESTEQTSKEADPLIAALHSAYVADCGRLAPGT